MGSGRVFSSTTKVVVFAAAIAAMVVSVGAPARAATTVNLVKNGGAEASTGTHIPGWTHTTGTTLAAAKYGSANGFPTKSSPGPAHRGKNFFTGGKDSQFSNEVIVQTISLSKYVAKIKGGHVTMKVSGFFGGVASQKDNAGLDVLFKDGGGMILGSDTTIGLVTPAQRHNVTGLLYRSATVTVPKSARSIYLDLFLDRIDGDYNNGYADNISVTLSGV